MRTTLRPDSRVGWPKFSSSRPNWPTKKTIGTPEVDAGGAQRVHAFVEALVLHHDCRRRAADIKARRRRQRLVLAAGEHLANAAVRRVDLFVQGELHEIRHGDHVRHAGVAQRLEKAEARGRRAGSVFGNWLINLSQMLDFPDRRTAVPSRGSFPRRPRRADNACVRRRTPTATTRRAWPFARQYAA